MSKKSQEKQKLKERFDHQQKLRQEMEERERPFKDRVRAIMEAPRFTQTDFWCDKCKKDCSGLGYRQVNTFRERLPTAWFTGFCPIGHRLIRRITDKDSDPYYDRSLIVQRSRYEMADDLMTPDDPRFKVLYPKQYDELTRNQR